MKTIQILGTGCPKCKKMETYTQSAVQQMNDSTVHFKSVDMSKPKINRQ